MMDYDNAVLAINYRHMEQRKRKHCVAKKISEETLDQIWAHLIIEIQSIDKTVWNCSICLLFCENN